MNGAFADGVRGMEPPLEADDWVGDRQLIKLLPYPGREDLQGCRSPAEGSLSPVAPTSATWSWSRRLPSWCDWSG